jgi:hypothetical protein
MESVILVSYPRPDFPQNRLLCELTEMTCCLSIKTLFLFFEWKTPQLSGEIRHIESWHFSQASWVET